MTQSFYEVITGAIHVKGHGKFKSGVKYPLRTKELYDLLEPLQLLGDVIITIVKEDEVKFGLAEPEKETKKTPAKPEEKADGNKPEADKGGSSNEN